jgi:hypothetical protein
MSEDQLYEVARKRVQQRNRRWMLWSIDLGVLILLLANLILMGSTFAVALFLGWGAIFVTHTIIAGFAESTQGSIDNEVAKLRAGLQYEKPKRLELGADGELTEIDASDEPSRQHSRHD